MKAGLLFATVAWAVSAGILAAETVPAPKLGLIGIERYTANGSNFVRLRFDVANKSAFPAALFAKSPHLPPCGTNAQASRSWVDFFEAVTNKRLYGFCALDTPDALGKIWFAVPEGSPPPRAVYVVIHDRQTGRKYQSAPESTDPYRVPNPRTP